MRAFAAAVVLSCVCGCQPAASTRGEGMRNLDIVHDQEDRGRVCTAVATLHAAHCAPFDAVEDAKLDDCSVVDGVYLSGYAPCVAGTGSGSDCEAVQACVAQADAGSAGPYVGPVRPCADTTAPTIPAGVSAGELAHSYDGGSPRLGGLQSGLEKPVEVCGTQAEVSFLIKLTCFDGSHVFADRAAAAAAARKPAGTGGRCGRMVDRVTAKCSDRAYDVFVDPYRCAAR